MAEDKKPEVKSEEKKELTIEELKAINEKLMKENADIKKAQSGSDSKVNTLLAEQEKERAELKAEKEKLLKEKMTADEKIKFEIEQERQENIKLKNEITQERLKLKTIDVLTSEKLKPEWKDVIIVTEEKQITEIVSIIKNLIEQERTNYAKEHFEKNPNPPAGGKDKKPKNNPFDKLPRS